MNGFSNLGTKHETVLFELCDSYAARRFAGDVAAMVLTGIPLAPPLCSTPRPSRGRRRPASWTSCAADTICVCTRRGDGRWRIPMKLRAGQHGHLRVVPEAERVSSTGQFEPPGHLRVG